VQATLFGIAWVTLAGLFLIGCRSDSVPDVDAQVIIGEIEVRPFSSSQDGEKKLPLTDESRLRKSLCSLRWIAFAPTNFDPQGGVFPSDESLWADLQTLKQAGFTGLITYGAAVLEPELAQKAGFQAMIVGIWDPQSKEETARAQRAASFEIVLGFAMGNEGLGVRYDRGTLKAAIEELRRTTSKPVTTSEQIEDYEGDPWLLALGDFVLPNAHPYWHALTDPQQAAVWTENQFRRLAGKTPKPILFKEVGLPSAGDPDVSEQNQAEYYRILGKSKICSAFFEFADQPWKQWAPVEPHWGLFHQDRSPKLTAQLLLEEH